MNDDGSGLKFGDPPTTYRKEKAYDWAAILAELKANPEKWALLEQHGKVSVHNAIKAGKIRNFHPTMGVDSRTANTDYSAKPRRAEIWIQYSPYRDESLTKKQADKVMSEARKREKEAAAKAAAGDKENV